jgi:DNA-directed RNA polymerase sigma subunit (sigma70/sigma32)
VSEDIEKKHMKQKVGALLGVLNKREREIVTRYYGIESGMPESYDLIALQLNICGERCRQICNDAIKKMKRYKKQINNF